MWWAIAFSLSPSRASQEIRVDSASPVWERKVRHAVGILHAVQRTVQAKGNSTNYSKEPPSALPCSIWKFHPGILWS